jgi:kojibiose phosphorylase
VGQGYRLQADRHSHRQDPDHSRLDERAAFPGQEVDASEPFPTPTEDRLWRLEVAGFDRFRERELESWFTVANGRTGTRGSLEEGSPESNPATYVAGVYGRLPDGKAGPELLIGPRWTLLQPRLFDTGVHLETGEILEHRRVLDFRQAILFRFWRQRLPSGQEVTFRSARFASLADRELLVLEAEGRCNGVPLSLGADILLPSRPSLEGGAFTRHADRVEFELAASKGGRAFFSISSRESGGRVQRLAAVARAALEGEPEGSVREALDEAQARGFRAVRDRHCSAWRERWGAADVVVDGDADAQLSLRFALYHLISAGDPDSDFASIGARGLTGPGYNGHVFWDTEVFALPYFLHTQPQVARQLIDYRFRTLPAARARARSIGYSGALFAWESADDGRDCTPSLALGPGQTLIPVLTGREEHHISADVAWAAWRYWEATRDEDFLLQAGAEIVLETARFWSSRARRGTDGRFHIAPVIGPDEYHEGVRDNAYTNLLAKWNLERGLEVAHLLSSADRTAWRSLTRRLKLDQGDLARWRQVAEQLTIWCDLETLLYEQFEGFFRLADLNAAELAPRPFAGELVLGRERLRRTQLIKQADVLMVMHMLPEVFPREVIEANYGYYEPRTSHGSSLSPGIHAAVAARLGRDDEALNYFRMAAAIDLDDRMRNAAYGIHMAAAASLWHAAVFGFGGVTPEAGCLRIDPHLPGSWSRLAFPFKWRDNVVRVVAEPSEVRIQVGSPTLIALGTGSPRQLSAGSYRATLRGAYWSPPEEAEARRCG